MEPGERRAITVSSPFHPESSRETGQRVRHVLDRHSDIVGSVATQTWSSAFTTARLRDRSRVEVGSRSDIAETAGLVTGRWSAPGNEPIEATAGVSALDALDASVGETVTLENTSSVFYDIDRRVLMFGVTKTGE